MMNKPQGGYALIAALLFMSAVATSFVTLAVIEKMAMQYKFFKSHHEQVNNIFESAKVRYLATCQVGAYNEPALREFIPSINIDNSLGSPFVVNVIRVAGVGVITISTAFAEERHAAYAEKKTKDAITRRVANQITYERSIGPETDLELAEDMFIQQMGLARACF